MKPITIYIAASWKHQHAVELLTHVLRDQGHQIISFVEHGITENGQRECDPAFDVEKWIESPDGHKKWVFDMNGAMFSDLVIYIGPSGLDAWAEVGAAHARGVPIYGLKAKGEAIGINRHMINKWFTDWRELYSMVRAFANAGSR